MDSDSADAGLVTSLDRILGGLHELRCDLTCSIDCSKIQFSNVVVAVL